MKTTAARRAAADVPLRICLLTYRGNPTCGGQGVYVKHLSRALRDLGHHVEVISGPPYPDVDEGIGLHKLPGLDLYNPGHMFKPARYRDLVRPINQFEFASMCLGGFPEPFTFGRRVQQFLSANGRRYDILHDNQSLAYGILSLARTLYPTVATIHHPLTVDRELEMRSAKTWRQRLKVWRWYSFLKMQKRVARRLRRIITVSECSKKDICRAYRVPEGRFRVVYNGINTDFFFPLPKVPRREGRLIVTSSADTPIKGLRYLLEAVSDLRRTRSLQLTVIGEPKKSGAVETLVRDLALGDTVAFTGRIPNEAFARYYAEAAIAVIPSLYEGFGMPAGEAMACGVPVISTAGGALPEVVGDAGIIVPPADRQALARAIAHLLDHPEERLRLGQAGLARVQGAFTWRHAAERTVEVYREVLRAHG